MSGTQWPEAGGHGPRPPVDRPLSLTQAASLANVFKALSEPVRLHLLSLIAARADGQACACEIVPACQVSQPTVAHHLRVLRDAGLLTSRRRAQRVHYRIVPEVMACLPDVLHLGTLGGGAPIGTPSR